MKEPWNWIKGGGVTSAKGFVAAAVSAGIKPSKKKDMSLVFSKTPAIAAGTFTRNQVKAATVIISMRHLSDHAARAVILNSGNANACTGEQGMEDAIEMAKLTAQNLSIEPSETLVCSTGRIGVPLPMDKIRKAIPKLCGKLESTHGKSAATGIMTSDSFHKECALSLRLGGKKITVGGMAKGAGMIHPNMATMLAVVTTDAAIDPAALQVITSGAVDITFNRISVDGDTSTNDTVLVLANSKAGNPPIDNADSEDAILFSKALTVCLDQLARMIVDDGESITHVVDLRVEGAASNADAKSACEAICRSPLVKTSWYGGDPNWGRLMDAIGYSPCKVDQNITDIYYENIPAVQHGISSGVPASQLREITKRRYFSITIDLNLGEGEHRMLVNDLTDGYVRYNMGE